MTETCFVSFPAHEEPVDPLVIKNVEQKVHETIKTYNLITPEDKVLIAVSGGKDSTACLHILKKLGYNLEAFTVDVHIGCYTKQNLENVKKLCLAEDVKLHVFSFRKSYGHSVCHVRSTLNKKGLNVSSCTVCGVLRRRLSNMAAKQAGATKLVTGHNMDDEVQSIVMNIFKNRQSLNARIGPKQKIIDTTTMVPRVKPLFFITEDEITQYSKAMKFPVHYGRCPCSSSSMRSVIRDFLDECKLINPNAIHNIMNFFFSVQERLSSKQSRKKLSVCTVCGEPTTTHLCRSCQILHYLKMPAQTS